METAAEARQEGSAKEWFEKRSRVAVAARATSTHDAQAPPLRRAVARRTGSGSGGAENDAVTVLIPAARMGPVGRLISRRRAGTPLPNGVTGGNGVCGGPEDGGDEPAFVTELVPGWQVENGRERRGRLLARAVWLAAAAAARPALARWREEAVAETRLAQMQRARREQWAEAVGKQGAARARAAVPLPASDGGCPSRHAPCPVHSASPCGGHDPLCRAAHRRCPPRGSGPAAGSGSRAAGHAQALRVCCGAGGEGTVPRRHGEGSRCAPGGAGGQGVVHLRRPPLLFLSRRTQGGRGRDRGRNGVCDPHCGPLCRARRQELRRWCDDARNGVRRLFQIKSAVLRPLQRRAFAQWLAAAEVRRMRPQMHSSTPDTSLHAHPLPPFCRSSVPRRRRARGIPPVRGAAAVPCCRMLMCSSRFPGRSPPSLPAFASRCGGRLRPSP